MRGIQRASQGCLLAVLSASSTLFFLLTFLAPLGILKFNATDRNSSGKNLCHLRFMLTFGSRLDCLFWHLLKNVLSGLLDPQHQHFCTLLNVANY